MREMKKFRSIYIDTEKNIYEINGEKAGFVIALKLEWTPDEGWALDITKDETYVAPMPKE